MNDTRSTTRRVRGILPDDPRLSACTLWLNTSTLTPPTQDKIRAAIHAIIEESEEFAVDEEGPEVVQGDEVRESGVAEEVPGRKVREVPVEVWNIWVRTYGLAGARRLAAGSGLEACE